MVMADPHQKGILELAVTHGHKGQFWKPNFEKMTDGSKSADISATAMKAQDSKGKMG